MTRIGALLALLAVCGVAHAQPAPRVVVDVDLPAAAGFALNHFALGPRLAVSGDGVHYVLQHQYASGMAGIPRIVLFALAPDGAVKVRRTLPIQAFALASLGIAVASSGDLAIFANPREQVDPSPAAALLATLLRLGADGSVKKTAMIGAPRPIRETASRHGYYHLRVLLPTPDNGLLAGGGFGSGLYRWWMGKVSLDGVRIWQASGGDGFMASVASIGPRPDGTWVSLAGDAPPENPRYWDIRRHAADGKLLAQRRGPDSNGHAAAVLREGSVFVTIQDVDDPAPARPQELIFVDDSGRIRRRVSWPFPFTDRLIADGDGFAAVVNETNRADTRIFVVRCDAQGTIRWRAEADAAEIVRTADGQIAALVRWGKEKEQRRLVRFADP